MANIDDINDKDLCTTIASVNGKDLVNLYSVNEILKSCTTCSRVDLAFDAESCENACRGEECVSYYTDGTVGALEVGDKIYSDNRCEECVLAGFYSDNACGGDQASCFTVDSDCTITRVDRCR